MSERVVGTVARVNGPVIHVRGVTDAMMMELVFVGEARLVGEIVKLTGDRAIVQVYEDTTGIRPTEEVFGSGLPHFSPGGLTTHLTYSTIAREDRDKIVRGNLERLLSEVTL